MARGQGFHPGPFPQGSISPSMDRPSDVHGKPAAAGEVRSQPRDRGQPQGRLDIHARTPEFRHSLSGSLIALAGATGFLPQETPDAFHT